jgi:hypothetical protein
MTISRRRLLLWTLAATTGVQAQQAMTMKSQDAPTTAPGAPAGTAPMLA